jgi:hypothetical protein
MERLTALIVMFMVCIWICCSGLAVAQDAPDGETWLAWAANTESDLEGYQVHRGTAPGDYDTVINVGLVTDYKVKGLVVGTKYYYALTAYDTSKNESGYSEEVSADATDRGGPVIPIGLMDVTPEANIIAETINIETINIINKK